VSGRVLIAEDDPQLRNLLALVVGRVGLVADVAADGAEALDKLAERPYALLLLDLMMPRLSGYEVISALTKFARRPAVIVLTAMTTERFLDFEADVVTAIIHKPFDIEMIGAIVSETATQLEKASAGAPTGEMQNLSPAGRPWRAT
jgi:two-component system response regulator (stage 0 sporulation protein F)